MPNETLDLLAQKLATVHLQVDWSEQTTDIANRATYAGTFVNIAKVSPTSVEQLQALVNAANELISEGHRIKLFTVSTGKNWGYGSSTPSCNNTVLVSLLNLHCEPEWVSGRHDKEQAYGKTLGLIKVGPGVTQQKLFDFLQREGGKFWMDATGSSPNCSVLANYITRGFGHTKAGDHADFISGMEVVLPNGELLKTGHAGCKNASNIGIHKHGIGPSLEGIFCQSNLGIVTAIYIQLLPAQKYTYKFFIKVASTDKFLKAIDIIAPLKLNGTLDSQMHCGNADKAIQAIMRFPFDRVPSNQGRIPHALKEQLCQENSISPWTISGAIYSNNAISFILKYFYFSYVFLSIGKPLILPKTMATALKSIVSSRVFKKYFSNAQVKLQPTLALLNELFLLKQGQPTDYFLQSVNHKKRTPCTDKDPDKDRVGLIWLAPIAPLHSDYAELLITTANSVFKKYDFDCPLSLTLLNTRALECIISIVYDRDEIAEEERAMKCHDELLAAFNQLGLTSYRSSVRAMQLNELNYSEALSKFLTELKSSIDPNQLLSENYYIPQSCVNEGTQRT